MIVSRFGSPVTVLAYCGKHQPKWSKHSLVLVQVQYADDGSTGFCSAHTLRADGGPAEIDTAVDQATERTLEGTELADALKQAE